MGIRELLIVKTHEPLIVMNHEDPIVHLGLDWLNVSGAGLFPSYNFLMFPGEKIFLKEYSCKENLSLNEEILVASE